MSRWAARAAVILGLCGTILLTMVVTLSVTTSAAAAESADARTRAWNWITSLLASPDPIGGVVEELGSISPDQDYAVDWTGPVAGTFTISVGARSPQIQVAAVELAAGSAAAATDPAYRGTVTGRVTLPAQAGRWILQAYRTDSAGVRQVPIQALAAADGTFTMDLSAGGDPGAGRWEVGVLDASAAYSPTGLRWPNPGTYVGWEVRSYAVTDRAYLIGTVPARADGTFAFDSSAPGRKWFELVAPGQGPAGADLVLARHTPSSGLIRSPGVDPGSTTAFAYDQGLALQAALVMDDRATAATLTRGLLAMQVTAGDQAGGFPFTASQSDPQHAPPVFRTGAHAVATYALLSALRDLPDGDPQRPAIRAAAQAAVDWLLAQQIADGPNAGLVTGGWGDWSGPDGSANPAPRIEWISTEHDLDAWHALSLAADVLTCSRCASAADQLRAAILTRLWQPDGGFRQGIQPTGPDLTEPLDVQTWGATWLDEIGRSDLAAVALQRTEAFRVTDRGIAGMLAFRAQPAMPHPVPTVWFEGTFGLALAQARHGDRTGHDATMAALAGAQRSDGSFPMATSADPDRELTADSSVAATAWFLLAGAPDDADGLWF